MGRILTVKKITHQTHKHTKIPNQIPSMPT